MGLVSVAMVEIVSSFSSSAKNLRGFSAGIASPNFCLGNQNGLGFCVDSRNCLEFCVQLESMWVYVEID